MTLPAPWADRLGSTVISIVMSGVMSGVMVVLNGGVGPHVVEAWLKAWAIGLLVSFPTATLIVPPVMRWSGRLRADPGLDRPSAP